jgi:hypothetical protein
VEELIENFRLSLSAYPRWLVVTCAIIVGVGLLFLLGKIIRFGIILAMVAIGIAGIAYLALSFLR